jgi:hypothetical protein
MAEERWHAGADADNFGQFPHGRPPILDFQRGGTQGSSIVLPLRRCAVRPSP